MMIFLKKCLTCLISCAIILYAMPRTGLGESTLLPGTRTPDEAAGVNISALREGGLRSSALNGGSYAFNDTTEYEFPEEEKEKLKPRKGESVIDFARRIKSET